MTQEEKKEVIAEILEVDSSELHEDQVLEEFETWDSVAVLSVIATMDEKFGKLPDASEVIKCKTVADLYRFME